MDRCRCWMLSQYMKQQLHSQPHGLAGRGRGQLKPGRHLDFKGDVPLTNLYLSMLDRVGVRADRIGDSDGRLPNI